MEYSNIIIFALIFVLLLTCFYLIINNFGINNDYNKYNNNVNVDNIEKKLLYIKSELYSIKSKINDNQSQLDNNILSQSNNSNLSQANKEIIIETDPNIQTNPLANQPINSNIESQSCGASGNCSKPPPIIYDPIANYDRAKLSDPLVDPRGRTSADQIPTPQVAAQFNFPTQGVLDRYHRVGLLIAIGSENKKNPVNKIEMPYLNSDSNSESNSEFVWEGPSKTNIKNKKRNKKRYISSNESELSNESNKVYKGVQIKEGFDSDSDYWNDESSIEAFESSDKGITNVYNIYSNATDNNILELIGKKITDNWYKYFTSISIGNKIIKVNVHNKNRKELYSGDIVYIPELHKEYRVKIDPMDMIEYNPYMF